MAEDVRTLEEKNQLLKKLRAIGSDLWGEMPEEAEAVESATEQTGQKPVVKRSAITLANLWTTADETIDWTEALSYAVPRDGLTDPDQWSFFHELAEEVLSGDTQAYARVLRKTNPLGDVAAYSGGMTMRAPSAQRVESTFVCRERLLKEKGKAYLCAIALRAARDLLACLPAEEAGITALWKEKVVLEVTYPREKLLHRNYRFLDPVAFSEECGAVYPSEFDFGADA